MKNFIIATILSYFYNAIYLFFFDESLLVKLKTEIAPKIFEWFSWSDFFIYTLATIPLHVFIGFGLLGADFKEEDDFFRERKIDKKIAGDPLVGGLIGSVLAPIGGITFAVLIIFALTTTGALSSAYSGHAFVFLMPLSCNLSISTFTWMLKDDFRKVIEKIKDEEYHADKPRRDEEARLRQIMETDVEGHRQKMEITVIANEKMEATRAQYQSVLDELRAERDIQRQKDLRQMAEFYREELERLKSTFGQ